MGCTNKRLNKTTINVLVSMFIAVGAAASASGIAAAQGSCVQQPDAIICRMPPERPLIVVGQQWEEVNEGTLEATGLQPVGAALWGSGNRLLNAAGARIDAENGPAPGAAAFAEEGEDGAQPAVGVRFVNFGGAHASGKPHLENRGVIQAVGTAAAPLPGEPATPPPANSGPFLPPLPIPLPIPPLFPPDDPAPEPPPPDDPIPVIPYRYGGVTGVRLWGHGVEALNTGTIRGVDNGGEDMYQPAVGLLSGYLPLVGKKADEAAATDGDGEGDVFEVNRIVNRGTGGLGLIEGEGYRAAGILLLGHETATTAEGWQQEVVNDGGTIRALGQKEAIGVDIVGGKARLHNEGIIEARAQQPGGAAAAVRAARRAPEDDGDVAPAAAPLAAAASSGGVHITNARLISATASTAVGILLDDSGVTFVNELGALVQAAGESAIGVWVTGDDNEVTNFGLIEARRPVGEADDGDGAPARGRVAAVALDGTGGTVVNEQTGTIRGAGTDAVGIDVRGDANTVENAGTIVGEAAGIAVGLTDPAATVSIHNKERGTIMAGSGTAIATYAATEDGEGAGSVHLRSEGSILGDVRLLHGGSHTVDISGFMDGSIVLGAGDDEVRLHDLAMMRGDILTGAGADTVRISGSKLEGNVDAGAGDDKVFVEGSIVTGDVRLGAGDDELTVTTTAKIEGAVDGGEGENTLVLTGDETGQLRGVERFRWVIVEDEGEWEFGQLSVDESRMDVEGELTVGVVWIGPGASLGIHRLVVDDVSIYDTHDYSGFLAGSGEIDGAVTMRSGFLSPGEAEGDMAQLTIRGDYVQEKDAVYVVDVSAGPADDAGYRPSDRIVLGEPGGSTVDPAAAAAAQAEADPDGPTAWFAEGTRIHVRAARGYYDPESTYLILDGALHEEMDEERLASIVVTTNTRFLVPTLKEGSLILVLKKDFTQGARTPNQRSVGRGISNAPAGALPHIEESLMFDLGDKGDAIRDALDQLSGEIYTTYLGVSETSLTQFARMVGRGMDLPVPAKDKKLWVDVYGHFGERAATAGTARAEFEHYGLVIGFGRDVSPRSRFGLMGGISRTQVDMPARNSKSTGSGWQLGAYGRWRGQRASLTGIVGFSEGRHDVERNIRFGTFHSLAKGRVRERAFGVYGEGRLHYEVSGFQVEPMLGLTWMDLSQGEVAETSGGEAALNIAKAGRDVMRLTAGVRVGTKPEETGVWPEFLLAWAYDFRDIPNEIDVRFAKSPDYTFPIEGTKVGRSALIAGVSMEGVRPSGMTWQFGYRGEFRTRRSVHTGTLSLHFPF